jgi:hypothetical protein
MLSAKKVQGRSVLLVREGLSFLKQRRGSPFFNSLLRPCGLPGHGTASRPSPRMMRSARWGGVRMPRIRRLTQIFRRPSPASGNFPMAPRMRHNQQGDIFPGDSCGRALLYLLRNASVIWRTSPKLLTMEESSAASGQVRL